MENRTVYVLTIWLMCLGGLVGCNDGPGNANHGGDPTDASDVTADVSDAGDTLDSEGQDTSEDARDATEDGGEDATADAADSTDATDVTDAGGSDAQQDADGGLSCTEPEEECDGACVDTTDSLEHCGACNSPCPTPDNTDVVCASSTCEFTCAEGWFDTDSDTSNGCECSQTNGGTEICDGVDNDCDGEVDEGCDEDGDGYCVDGATVEAGATCQEGDCDDTNPAINPGAAPACDGADTNCDGNADNILPRPAAQQTLTLSGSYSAGRDYPSPVVSTFTGDGFCVAALDDTAGTLEFASLQTGGQSQTYASSVPAGVAVDVLDIEWDGANCAVLYREGGTSLKLRRWTPGTTSTTTIEVSSELSDEDNWEGVRNAALWFGTVRRCTGGTCTPAPRWVVAWVRADPNFSDDVVFNTVPKAFTSGSPLLAEVTVDTSASVNGDVDVVGPDTSGDGFMVLDKTSLNYTSIREIYEEQASLRSDLSINNDDLTRSMMNEVNGSLFLQMRRRVSSSTRQTRLSTMTASGFGLTGYALSEVDDDYLGRNFVWTVDGVEQFYIDGYSDKVYLAYETGSGTTFYDFSELTHPNFGTFNELLAPGRDADSFWVARLVGEAPYEIALDAYGCY